MALNTEKKLYAALGVLAVLGGGLYLQQKKATEEEKRYTREGREAELPNVAVSEDDAKKVDKIIINEAKTADGGAAEEFVLVRKKEGEDQWALEKPIPYKANDSNVKSLIGSISKLKVTELIDSSTESYEKHKVSDDTALHARFLQGDKTLLDLYFGDGGGRGQMTRIPGKDGVYGVKGYSSYMFARDLKGWRDLTIFKFEDGDVVSVAITNENGDFDFEKKDGTWGGKFKKAKTPAAAAIKDFKSSKLEDLLRAYKTLNAAEFGDSEKLATTGLEKPSAVVTIKLKDNKATYELSVGEKQGDTTNRWVKANGSDQIFSVSSWAADWATGNVDKFQDPEAAKKKDEKKDVKKDEKGAEPPDELGGGEDEG